MEVTNIIMKLAEQIDEINTSAEAEINKERNTKLVLRKLPVPDDGKCYLRVFNVQRIPINENQ